MRYTKEEIQKVNDLNIIDVAEKLGMTLKRRGDTVMALCPCHEDTHPSMQIGGRRNIAHCYVCGKTLNPIGLVLEVTHCSFKEAMESLSPTLPLLGYLMQQAAKRHTTGCRAAASHFRAEERDGSKYNRLQKNAKKCSQSTSNGQRSSSPSGEAGEVLFFSLAYVDAHVSMDNALSKCLLQRFPIEVVERVTQMYRLGHDEELLHYEHTWFPSIDEQGRVRNIKVQGYCTNPDVPMFCHSVKGQTLWLGAVLQKREQMDRDRMFDNECLFGAWTLSAHSGTSPLQGEAVILVESPKNAVVGACWTMTYRPELNVTWVAVGNKGMLKRKVLEPLRGRRVIVIPDRDAIDEWKAKIGTMRDLATFVFSSFCESRDDPENRKLDIADLMMSQLLQTEVTDR